VHWLIHLTPYYNLHGQELPSDTDYCIEVIRAETLTFILEITQ